MIFSSTMFLWVFLPLVCFFYYLVPRRFRNIILLAASILFYAWGEPKYIILLCISILINYICGIGIDNSSEQLKKIIMVICIIINIGLLCYFKYFNFLADIVNMITGQTYINLQQIVLPIGISFYTFQALSYVVDLYRGEIKVQKSIWKLSLYILFFPQLIAGPIVRYIDIESQIDGRTESLAQFSYGIRRFIIGLSKKVIIANTMAQNADTLFSLEFSQMTQGYAWMGALFYMFQIYFDFSGYSDMAIGLGNMFGFSFQENFNLPYVSKSIQEFWRRWHISLSTWFREYLYIPLGGNRKGRYRTYLNLFIVFLCTGLWHGASLNFVVWGLYHGIFLILERAWLGERLKNNSLKWLNQIYALLVVLIGWVIFRSDTIYDAAHYLTVMFVPRQVESIYNFRELISNKAICILLAACVFSGIWQGFIMPKVKYVNISSNVKKIVLDVLLLLMMLYSIILLVCDTYNPFIYFRF